MPAIRSEIMQKLYGEDILSGFKPIEGADLQGWNGDHPSLARLISVGSMNIVADVGVWKGQSTINMAVAMKKKVIDGVVIAIDTFIGSIEHWRRGVVLQALWYAEPLRDFSVECFQGWGGGLYCSIASDLNCCLRNP